MKLQDWASGAKLTWQDVAHLRKRKFIRMSEQREIAALLGVHKDTLWRALNYRTWKVKKVKTLPNAWKKCVICKKKFERRFANGRHRSDRQWNQKHTCGNSCAIAYKWQLGVYANR